MKKTPIQFQYLYGPVYSWRMGMSLGIDPLSTRKKICNFNCVYCQLGRTVQFLNKRKNFITVESLIKEIQIFPHQNKIDYYTFSGRGEPTLAKNLGNMILAVKKETKGRVAVITDAALMDQSSVQEDLSKADFVLAKLDACDQNSMEMIDHPASGILFERIIEGLRIFQKNFSGKLALQIMFIQNNKHLAHQIAHIAREINADEIQINTPLRPSSVRALTEQELQEIKRAFQGLPAIHIYERKRKIVQPVNEQDTLRRHGNWKKQ